MTRYAFLINSTAAKEKAVRAINQAPFGTRIELKASKRTLPQSAKMWVMLGEIAMQKEHNGRKYPPDVWKVLMMSACGRELQFIPALDGTGFIPYGNHSSDLSKQEMSDLIEFMTAWGTENGIVFHAPKSSAKDV